MLILTRREGESIIIFLPGYENSIEVRVMKAGAQVSLGIEARRMPEMGWLKRQYIGGMGLYWVNELARSTAFYGAPTGLELMFSG